MRRPRFIGRTLEDARILADVAAQFGFGDQKDIGVVRCGTPIEDVIDPIRSSFPCFVDAVIVDEMVFMIIGVEGSRQGELADIAEAGGALSFALCFAEGRQEHPR